MKFFSAFRPLAGRTRRLLQKLVRLHHDLIFVINPETAYQAECKIRVDFARIMPCDIPRLEQTMKNAGEFHPGMLAKRFQDKELAWGVIVDGQIVHYDFVTFSSRWLDIVEQEFPLGQGEAFIYNCHTLEGWRGKGLFTCSLASLLRFLADSGIRRCYIDADAGNKPSINAIKRAGFKMFQSRYMLRILGRPVARFQPGG